MRPDDDADEPVPIRAAVPGGGGGPSGRTQLDDETGADTYVGDVLELVAAIPPGMVLTYGDVAREVGRGGPRQVGQVMSRWGGSVPWWRVLRADGRPALGHEQRALAHYAQEDTPLRPDGERVDLRRARWDLAE
jgi:alkylated DNA nucleotide flippase Atl1